MYLPVGCVIVFGTAATSPGFRVRGSAGANRKHSSFRFVARNCDEKRSGLTSRTEVRNRKGGTNSACPLATISIFSRSRDCSNFAPRPLGSLAGMKDSSHLIMRHREMEVSLRRLPLSPVDLAARILQTIYLRNVQFPSRLSDDWGCEITLPRLSRLSFAASSPPADTNVW